MAKFNTTDTALPRDNQATENATDHNISGDSVAPCNDDHNTVLGRIHVPADMKALRDEELHDLCEDVRRTMI